MSHASDIDGDVIDIELTDRGKAVADQIFGLYKRFAPLPGLPCPDSSMHKVMAGSLVAMARATGGHIEKSLLMSGDEYQLEDGRLYLSPDLYKILVEADPDE